MSKIFIGSRITPKKKSITKFIRCCSCRKEYDFKGNIFKHNKDNILICPYCGLKHKVDFKFFGNKIENLEKIYKLDLAVIDIGEPAIVRPTTYSENQWTVANIGNPANGTGKITSVEIYVQSYATDMLDVEFATFYIVSGNNLSTRDHEYIGTIDTSVAGHHQFDVDLDVQEGDYLGFVTSTQTMIYLATSGGEGTWYHSGDEIPCTNVTFGIDAGWVISLYGTGITPPAVGNALFFGSNF